MHQTPQINFLVTIDAEEDDWGYISTNSSVKNIRMVPRLQKLFDHYKIKPTYLVSYEVASCDWAVDIFSDIASRNRCEIGAHLHPWNTPPIREEISERNSMMKNLSYELQVEKINVLTEKIERAFGSRPRSFRAGRWGLGKETIKALIASGYVVDSSVTPTLSWRSSGDGPEFLDTKITPYQLWTDGVEKEKSKKNSILEVPVTIGFNRWPFEVWQNRYLQLQKEWLRPLHVLGIMNRTGFLKKIWLTPEGQSAADMIILAKNVIQHGVSFVNMSFHTTSLLPAKSPFVKNEQDLEQFYIKIEKLLEFLSVTTNLNAVTLAEVPCLKDTANTEGYV